MNKIPRFLISLISVLMLTGCSLYHVDSQDISEEFYPSKGSAIDVLYLETVNEPHEIIADAIVNTERRQSFDNILALLKREAAILGGDAITDIQSDATGPWKRLPGQRLLGNAYVRSNYRAKVLVLHRSTFSAPMTTQETTTQSEPVIIDTPENLK